MKITKHILFIFVMAMTVSCQKSLICREANGQISLLLENSPIVDVVTKASEDAVSIDDFNVYINSEDATFTYVYKDMPSVITVPVGLYTISAENVSEVESLTLPDQWGQVRYAGVSEEKEVSAGMNPTQYSVSCTMVNTAVSVAFGENVDKHFSDFSITAYTVDTRKLQYTPENTSGSTPVVGYFSSGVKLNYIFTGTYIIDDKPVTITGSKDLSPATHLHLTFKMSAQNGSVGKPNIEVDATCEDLYETITVDPSEGGSFVIE